ncbi:hypothetical protein [Actinokineospora iranica]|nr:hypothetical protein [Actinokineospora iranica]
MSTCGECGDPVEAVVMIDKRGVPHGDDGHNVVYDHTTAFACPKAHGSVAHFSHDCFAPPWEEEWDMWWSWELTEAAVDALRTGLVHCPAPLDPDCECAAHISLRKTRPLIRKARVSVTLSKAGVPAFASL